MGGVNNTPGGTGFVKVALGNFQSGAIRGDGTYVLWGDSFNMGLVGPPTSTILDLAFGEYWGVAVLPDGSLNSWGSPNVSGGPVANTPGGSDYVKVWSNSFTGVAMRTDGTLVGWGFDGFGVRSGVPAGSFEDVVMAEGHAIAVRADGSLVAWGSDTSNYSGLFPNSNVVA